VSGSASVRYKDTQHAESAFMKCQIDKFASIVVVAVVVVVVSIVAVVFCQALSTNKIENTSRYISVAVTATKRVALTESVHSSLFLFIFIYLALA